MSVFDYFTVYITKRLLINGLPPTWLDLTLHFIQITFLLVKNLNYNNKVGLLCKERVIVVYTALV